MAHMNSHACPRAAATHRQPQADAVVLEVPVVYQQLGRVEQQHGRHPELAQLPSAKHTRRRERRRQEACTRRVAALSWPGHSSLCYAHQQTVEIRSSNSHTRSESTTVHRMSVLLLGVSYPRDDRSATAAGSARSSNLP